MKVLLINTFDFGGAANACVRLHKGLLKKGIDSKMLVLKKENADIPECYSLYESHSKWFIKRAQDKLVSSKQYKIKNLPKGYEPFNFPFSSHRLENHPLIEWADVINLHWVAQFVNYPSFFKKLNKPVVWTLHDMNPFTGGYHYLEGFPIGAYEKYIKKNEEIKAKALKDANVSIVALNKWLKEMSANSVAFNHLPHHIIPNGIDTTVFKPINKKLAREVMGLDEDKKVLLFVSESVSNKRKGYNILLEALNYIKDKNLTLAILGSKSSNLETHLDIRKMGRIYDERLMAIAYSAADLFIIPSIEDNLPNTVVESICCGTPVVGFNIGGIPDMITNHKNGLLCEDINAEALAASIQEGLDTKFDEQWIRNDAVSRFDESVQSSYYIKLFKSLAK